jgi:hypothetical protein
MKPRDQIADAMLMITDSLVGGHIEDADTDIKQDLIRIYTLAQKVLIQIENTEEDSSDIDMKAQDNWKVPKDLSQSAMKEVPGPGK